jgi:hypothetical protein
LEFETRLGEKSRSLQIAILLAEDTTGGGNEWHLTGDQP